MKALRRICAAALGIASFAAAAITVLVNWPDFWAMYGEGLQGGWRGFLGLFYDHGLAIGMASALALGVGLGLMFAHRPHAPAAPTLAGARREAAVESFMKLDANQAAIVRGITDCGHVYYMRHDHPLLAPMAQREIIDVNFHSMSSEAWPVTLTPDWAEAMRLYRPEFDQVWPAEAEERQGT